jgi:hypothetical protein
MQQLSRRVCHRQKHDPTLAQHERNSNSDETIHPHQHRRRASSRKYELGLKERWHPIQVKQKDKVGRPDIDAFEAVMMREDCEKGFFVPSDDSPDALTEIDAFFKRSHKVIVALTVKEILDEQIAKRLV